VAATPLTPASKYRQLADKMATLSRPSTCPKPWITTCYHRLLPRLWFCRKNTLPYRHAKRVRRGVHGQNFNQGICTGSNGTPCGWIAAAGGLASDEKCEIPIVILFPEIPFNQKTFLAKVDSMVKKHGYCTVVVSEGVQGEDGKFLADQA